jgi:hypothetical protein
MMMREQLQFANSVKTMFYPTGETGQQLLAEGAARMVADS